MARYLHTVTSVLNYAARVLRDGNRPWLTSAPPKLTPPDWADHQEPYRLTWEEQDRLIAELPHHLVDPCLFSLATGAREQEVVTLSWASACQVTGLEDYSIWWIPSAVRKQSARGTCRDHQGRYLVCNAMARSVIRQQLGNGSPWVFPGPNGERVQRYNNTAFRNARKKAGIPCRWHDLRHTFGERLAAGGVPWDTRKALLGHSIGEVTARYSAPGLAIMLAEAEKITRDGVSVLRLAANG